MPWVFDHVEKEVVTKDELARREAKRPHAKFVKADFIPDMPERGSWVYHDGKLIPKWEWLGMQPVRERSTMVIGALQDYQSMHDGSWITGRTAHREHLKRHGLIEYGNDKKASAWQKKEMPPVEEDIKDAIDYLEAGHPAPSLGGQGDQKHDLGDLDV